MFPRNSAAEESQFNKADQRKEMCLSFVFKETAEKKKNSGDNRKRNSAKI